MARFISYALCAADEALKDANWIPSEQDEKEKTVNSHKFMSFSLFLFILTTFKLK